MKFLVSDFVSCVGYSVNSETNVCSNFEQIDSLSSVRLIIPKDLLPLEARENTLKKVSEVLSRFAKEGMPLLDPEEDMKVGCIFQFQLRFCSFVSTSFNFVAFLC